LVFVKIHPFADGNGRAARLIEKWFLAQYLGNIAWSVPSEINYYLKRDKYYDTLKVGSTYEEVDYTMALPFLLLLPSCFSISKKYYAE
jgi:Fic family protein